MKKNVAKRRFAKAVKAEKVFKEHVEMDEIKKVAKDMTKLLNDPFFRKFKLILANILDIKKGTLNHICTSNRSSNDDIRIVYTLSGQIVLLENILNMPERFIEECNTPK